MSIIGRSAPPVSSTVPVAGTSLADRPAEWTTARPVAEPLLTGREGQVLGLVGLGLTNREIGSRLGIAEKTVKNTVTMVLAKLGLQRRTQAAIYVTVRQLTPPQP